MSDLIIIDSYAGEFVELDGKRYRLVSGINYPNPAYDAIPQYSISSVIPNLMGCVDVSSSSSSSRSSSSSSNSSSSISSSNSSNSSTSSISSQSSSYSSNTPFNLLLEDGEFMLLEDGFDLLME